MILKEDGFILMTVPIEAKVVYISANKDTAQLAVAFKNKIETKLNRRRAINTTL